MPHSSGGGSHGGGFHGGSAGHGGSSGPRTSRHYYPGARTFVYYRHGIPMYIYSDADLRHQNSRKNRRLTSLVLLPFVMILVFLLIVTMGPPTKLSGGEMYPVEIIDNIGVLKNNIPELEKALNDFKDTTGITPAVLTVYNEDWTSKYNLTDYAYNAYIDRYSDEMHWLIVYSEPKEKGDDFIYWHFEGMQGNDTDSILSYSKTESFNSDLYKYLNEHETYTVGQAITEAFNNLTPVSLEESHDIGNILPIALMLIILLFIFVANIFGDKLRGYKDEDLTEIKSSTGKPQTANCEYCGSQYAVGAHTRCPHCGASLTDTTDEQQY